MASGCELGTGNADSFSNETVGPMYIQSLIVSSYSTVFHRDTCAGRGPRARTPMVITHASNSSWVTWLGGVGSGGEPGAQTRFRLPLRVFLYV
jgi:hypothetical protein